MCLLFRRFFERKLHYYPDEDTKLPYVRPSFDEIVAEADSEEAIDRTLQASGDILGRLEYTCLHGEALSTMKGSLAACAPECSSPCSTVTQLPYGTLMTCLLPPNPTGFKSKYQKVLEDVYAEQDAYAADSGESDDAEDGDGEEEEMREGSEQPTRGENSGAVIPNGPTEHATSSTKASLCTAARGEEKTFQWVMDSQNQQAEYLVDRLVAVTLAAHGEESVSCEIRSLCEISACDDLYGPASSSSGSDDNADSVAQARRQRKEKEVHQRVVAQQRAKAKKASSMNASRNAMKNKVKKGKRGHSGKDGW